MKNNKQRMNRKILGRNVVMISCNIKIILWAYTHIVKSLMIALLSLILITSTTELSLFVTSSTIVQFYGCGFYRPQLNISLTIVPFIRRYRREFVSMYINFFLPTFGLSENICLAYGFET